MAWTDNGPVSTPPRGVVYVAAGLILIAAGGGGYLGFKASLRDTSHESGQAVDDSQGLDQAQIAKPIVDIPAMQAPPPEAAAANALAAATNTVAKTADDDDDTNDIAVRTAAVQNAQNNPAKPAPDPDLMLASPDERPQPPAKPSTDDQPPTTAPAKTDVPF